MHCSSELTVKHRRLAEIIEMIHTASLIHDDVLDESDLRRGKPVILFFFFFFKKYPFNFTDITLDLWLSILFGKVHAMKQFYSYSEVILILSRDNHATMYLVLNFRYTSRLCQSSDAWVLHHAWKFVSGVFDLVQSFVVHRWFVYRVIRACMHAFDSEKYL